MNISTVDEQVFYCLYNPGEFNSPAVDYNLNPEVILKGFYNNPSLIGLNSIFHQSSEFSVCEILYDTESYILEEPISFDFLYFSQKQRDNSNASYEKIQSILNENINNNVISISELVPYIAIVVSKNNYSVYHFNDLNYQGGIFLNYYRDNLIQGNKFSLKLELHELINKGKNKLRKCRHLLNDTCWYSKWNSEYELERKFTFKGIPNTWELNNNLYKLILDGGLPGFVPELDMEFQVFDYESHIFEVTAPEEQQGYISFIPQSDGRMTIKRKWFVENDELRKEHVNWDQDIALDDMEKHVTKMSDGSIKKMPAFRRKRFDVNFESLESGHIFGVYFDICRLVDRPEIAFAQCEVEYCRTRTLNDLTNVLEEFEKVAEFTSQFLNSQKVNYEKNLYSKLDFVKENVA